MSRPRSVCQAFFALTLLGAAPAWSQSNASEAPATAAAEESPEVPRRYIEPAQRAFEEGRWEDAIAEYRELLAAYPEDRLSPLRIAQAERELGRYEQALRTLDLARAANAPEAMVDFERARNLAHLRRYPEALEALEIAEHSGLRGVEVLDTSRELDPLREDLRFRAVYIRVRARVFPCELLPEAAAFDFWLGEWEVRMPDGSLLGHDKITKGNGGCSIHESWEGSGVSTGSSTSFYLPSRKEWRQIWVGSSGTMFDIVGGVVDGVMRMEGTIEYVEPNRVVAFRGTWSRGVDGFVRQKLEEFDVVTGNWVVWFDGLFRRVVRPD